MTIWDRIIQNPLPALRQFIKWEETREAEKFVLTSQLQSLFPWTELVMLPPVHTQGYHTRGETIKDITVGKWQSPSDRVRVKSVSPCDSSRVWVRLTGGVSWSAFDWATPKPHVSHPLLSPLTLGNFHPDYQQSLSTVSPKDKIFGSTNNFAPSSFESSSSPSTSRSHQHQIGPKMIGWFTRIRITDPRSSPFLWILPLSTTRPKTFLVFLLPTCDIIHIRSKCFWAHPVYQCPLVSAQSLLSR